MRAFKSIRPRDINLQVGVPDRAGSLKYYLFDEPALNTFDEDIVASRLANTPYKLVATVEVPVERLETLLSLALAAGPGNRLSVGGRPGPGSRGAAIQRLGEVPAALRSGRGARRLVGGRAERRDLSSARRQRLRIDRQDLQYPRVPPARLAE